MKTKFRTWSVFDMSKLLFKVFQKKISPEAAALTFSTIFSSFLTGLKMGNGDLLLLRALVFLMFSDSLLSFAAGTVSCDFGVVHQNTLYNYSLASPSAKSPHGILSEDGYFLPYL
jgi:hypothetical protein